MDGKIIRHLQVRPGVWLRAEVDPAFERRHGRDITRFADAIGNLLDTPDWEIDYDPLEWVD